MGTSSSPESFQTTRWSLILRAQSSQGDLEDLLRLYWAPIHTTIVRAGRGGADADDLTQQFISQVLLGRDMVTKAEQSRGRFRAFLRTSLKRFLIDQQRRSTAKKAGPTQGALSLDVSLLGDETESTSSDTDTAFDRQWAARVMSLALERLEERCRKQNLIPHWEAFYAVVVGPTTRRTTAPSLAELAEELGIESPATVSNMIQTIKRKFRRELRSVVMETVDDPGLVDDEIAVIRASLRGGFGSD